jgi:hypothetical protein
MVDLEAQKKLYSNKVNQDLTEILQTGIDLQNTVNNSKDMLQKFMNYKAEYTSIVRKYNVDEETIQSGQAYGLPAVLGPKNLSNLNTDEIKKDNERIAFLKKEIKDLEVQKSVALRDILRCTKLHQAAIIDINGQLSSFEEYLDSITPIQ